VATYDVCVYIYIYINICKRVRIVYVCVYLQGLTTSQTHIYDQAAKLWMDVRLDMQKAASLTNASGRLNSVYWVRDFRCAKSCYCSILESINTVEHTHTHTHTHLYRAVTSASSSN